MRRTLRIDSTRYIMMPAKLWCNHAEGFESCLRAWELDVGEWERASGTALADAVKYTVMMNMAPIFLMNSLQLGTYPKSAALRAALLQWCYSSRNFGANPTLSAGNIASEDDDRMQVGWCRVFASWQWCTASRLSDSRVQDKRYRCQILESTLQVEHDSNMTEDDW